MTIGILLVDPQYDFFPGGALGVAGGDEIVLPINDLLRRHPAAPVFASRDWHPPGTRHFQTRGGIWPPHCVQGTRGAAFHAELQMGRALVFDKGMNPEDDAGYSAFEAVREEDGRALTLGEELRRAKVQALIVAGLATDYCVKASVLDALKHGLMTFVYKPGVRAVNLKPADGAQALVEMRVAGALLAE
jgi:nicotinamidase/pyrazinamidase